MMERRRFLAGLLAAIVAQNSRITEADVVARELERIRGKIPTLFDRDDVFYNFIERKQVAIHRVYDMRIPLQLKPRLNFGRNS